MSGNVIDVKTNDQFNKIISGSELMIILFSLDGTQHCKHVEDVMEVLSKQDEFKIYKYLKIQADVLDDISMKYKIEAVPTVIFQKDQKITDRIEGVDIEQLKILCIKYTSLEPRMILEGRLKQLINKFDVMIFMKGDRTTPRCGFSKQIIAIIELTKVPFETFDILTDEEVRQGLKKYSDWPTYPQVYVKGELIGGLDIIKELSQSGELESTLKG